MYQRSRWTFVALLVIGGLQQSACRDVAVEAASESHHSEVKPIEGTDFSLVTLSEQAVERLGIETAPVANGHSNGGKTAARTMIPYSALLYGPSGETWTYINPEPLVFRRHDVTVKSIRGNRAILSSGPPAGTAVVTVGAAELLGTEFGVGH